MPEITPSPRIRKSPFYEATVADGVTDFTVYNKMLLPLSFGDLRAEYDRLIKACPMWDVSVERQVQITGPDAAQSDAASLVKRLNEDEDRPGEVRGHV